jgi:hypothetical protein
MTLYWLALVFKATAALLAFAVGRKCVEHRPVAWLFGGSVLADISRLALQTRIIRPAREAIRAAGLDPSSVLLTGWARVAIVSEAARSTPNLA